MSLQTHNIIEHSRTYKTLSLIADMVTSDNHIVEEIDCVEEIVKRDPSIIPKRYILTEKDVSKDMELPLLSAEVPVIDLSLLSQGQEEELKKLYEACKYWGFFLVTYDLLLIDA